MKKSIILGLLSASMLTSVAHAEDNKYYTQFNLGLSAANSTKYNSTYTNNVGTYNYSYDGSLGGGALVGAEFGTRLNDNFRVGLSLDYRSYENDLKGSGLLSGQERTLETKSLATMLNGYYDFTKGDGFNPYVTVGLGIANNEQEANGKNGASSFASKENTSFAYKLGLGAKYQINNSVDLDIRYQYVDLGKVSLGNLDNGYTNTTTKSANLRANEVLVGIAYKF